MYAFRYSINNKFTVNSSFFVTQCGIEECAPGHRFGPVTRDHNLLHFVFSGKGYLEIYNKKYTLKAGQGFFIPSSIMATYCASNEDPWEYGWLGFDGENSYQKMALRGISTEKLIFNFGPYQDTKKCITDLISAYGKEGNGFSAISKLFETFSYINPEHNSSSEQFGLINKVIVDIEKSFGSPLTVDDISKKYNISRSQLFRLFKKKLDISPQQYIKNFRIAHSADLLRRTDLSITEIMYLSGFSNLSNFSRQFKSVYLRSPKEYREYVSTHTANKNSQK